LNSTLLNWRFSFIGKLKSAGILEYFWNSVSKLPIRRIDFKNRKDVAAHGRMVELVDRVVRLISDAETTKSESERTALGRAISEAERQIDSLVFQLYDIREDDLRLIRQIEL